MEEDHRVMIETWREMEADLKDAAENWRALRSVSAG